MGEVTERSADAALRDRVCEASLACIARWGITKTTLDDVAREAGCSRATIYRAFQGGKAEVLAATLAREVERFRAEVGGAIDGTRDDLEEAVVAGVVAAARFLRGHDALAYLLAREPDVVLPWIAFQRMGRLYDTVGEFAAPFLARFIPEPHAARRAAEWLARVVLTHVVNPAPGCDLADPAEARHLLSTYVIPGLARAARSTNPEEPCPAA
ncbi:MAG TPA: TetR/AcrR family transcriptional regulator [Acidimicrobiales bacterium]|nr:TetR/AcrR family transcriptional regulator [Acidimicrobiales bacterium]